MLLQKISNSAGKKRIGVDVAVITGNDGKKCGGNGERSGHIQVRAKKKNIYIYIYRICVTKQLF